MDANVAPNLQRSSPPTKLKFACVLFTACFCWWLVCNQFTELVNPPQQMDVASPKRSKPATARRRASSDIVREGDSLPSGKTPLNPLSGSVWLAPEDAAHWVHDASTSPFLPLPVIIYILIGLWLRWLLNSSKVKATTSEGRQEEQRGNEITDDGDGEGWEGTQIETPGERLKGPWRARLDGWNWEWTETRGDETEG